MITFVLDYPFEDVSVLEERESVSQQGIFASCLQWLDMFSKSNKGDME